MNNQDRESLLHLLGFNSEKFWGFTSLSFKVDLEIVFFWCNYGISIQWNKYNRGISKFLITMKKKKILDQKFPEIFSPVYKKKIRLIGSQHV